MDENELQERIAELIVNFENLEDQVLETLCEAQLLHNVSDDKELLAYLDCLKNARNALL